MMPFSKFWRDASITIVSLGTLLLILRTQVHMTLNQTPSLSYKVFFCIRGLTLKRGDFVGIRNHLTAYFKGVHYTKRLMGLPGDLIYREGQALTLSPTGIPKQKSCERNTCKDSLDSTFLLHSHTQDGKPLHSLKSTIIPEGTVFVSADHPRSFDSRYEAFGLVKKEHLIGRCWGFFKMNTPSTPPRQEQNP